MSDAILITNENIEELVDVLTDKEALENRNIRLYLKGSYFFEMMTSKCYIDNDNSVSAFSGYWIKWYWKVKIGYNDLTWRVPVEKPGAYEEFRDKVRQILLERKEEIK